MWLSKQLALFIGKARPSGIAKKLGFFFGVLDQKS
jgi:hypothetical protein